MAANKYAREILHHTEPPPPVEARFFYTSPIPIDDPLAPLPPPASGGTWASGQPPKPFSAYDNAALDEAWHVLRKKILKYNEEHGEKPRSQGRDRNNSSSVRDGKQPSRPSTPATAQTKPVRRPASSQGQVEPGTSPEDQSSALDGPHPHFESASPSNTTGTPFVRAPSRKRVDTLRSSRGEQDTKRPSAVPRDTYSWEDRSHLAAPAPTPLRKPQRPDSPTAKVAVGMSRLHQVEMPGLQMTPIYWTPVNDTAEVIRGTWFYEDTMLPVETAVANMLEAGYLELQVWTDTWRDELASAIEVGALGEMKIAHKLWPDKPDSAPRSRPSSMSNQNLLHVVASNLVESEPKTPEQMRQELLETACDAIDIASGPGGADNKSSGNTRWGANGSVRTYLQCGVIYADERYARILKPSLLPSAYYGRRPLANYIRKDRNLGIKVVRGFDQSVWDRLHPPKKTKLKADFDTSISVSGSASKQRKNPGPASEADPAIAEKSKVTDLVLVIHGIGQKLSQRMESFHFTHAINAFRRDVNVELATRDVKLRLRNGMGGVMTLPINWRHLLSFEEGGYSDESDALDDFRVNKFGLSDITPETLPSVRNIVSDVMLDIPYYMSHHQPKMIAAVIREANRVYKLWCANNPGFHQYGRVHIIAHSLGSVMAVDILSRQPTCVPDHLDDPLAVDLETEDLDHFLFNTSNLFLAGSPAGFFLLLKKSQLLPRIDHPSATADPDLSANTHVICGERGTYGCLPVDNVFNVINPYDPVSYRMNAAVDNTYAASLKQAWVPSATSSWLGMSFFGSGASGTNAARTSVRLVATLPSNVELETHNFNREEIAEKRMYLLNDNGQIDFFLKYGGGPLEIQYLTMLGAHSSYWLLKDFVRMVVTEVGREPGRDGTLVGMRAVKKKGAVV